MSIVCAGPKVSVRIPPGKKTVLFTTARPVYCSQRCVLGHPHCRRKQLGACQLSVLYAVSVHKPAVKKRKAVHCSRHGKQCAGDSGGTPGRVCDSGGAPGDSFVQQHAPTSAHAASLIVENTSDHF